MLFYLVSHPLLVIVIINYFLSCLYFSYYTSLPLLIVLILLQAYQVGMSMGMSMNMNGMNGFNAQFQGSGMGLDPTPFASPGATMDQFQRIRQLQLFEMGAPQMVGGLGNEFVDPLEFFEVEGQGYHVVEGKAGDEVIFHQYAFF